MLDALYLAGGVAAIVAVTWIVNADLRPCRPAAFFRADPPASIPRPRSLPAGKGGAL